MIIELKEAFTNPEIRVIVVEALMLTLQNALEFVSGKALTDSRVVFGYPRLPTPINTSSIFPARWNSTANAT